MIVEGEGEIFALEKLVSRVKLTNSIIQRPLRADLQPKATSEVIARSAARQVQLCVSRGVNRVVVLIDRENSPCPVAFCKEIEDAFNKIYAKCGLDFRVVVKDRMIENWLISDVSALRQMSARFQVTQAFERAVSPDKADTVESPVQLLNSIAKKIQYRKGSDPLAICERQDPLRVAGNSRSFRKFLREIGVVEYGSQSKHPHDSPRLQVKKPARRK